MEATFARVLQFTLAGLAAFSVALWFAMAVWTYRDIERRSTNVAVQILATLVVVLGFLPGIVIYLLLRPRETLEQRYQREIEDSYLAQEIGSIAVCPDCAHPIKDEFMFCPDCGNSLRRTCGNCSRLVDADWKICAFCGHDLPYRSSTPTSNGRGQSAIPPEPQRRHAQSGDWEVDMTSDDIGEPPASAAPGKKSRARRQSQERGR
jgi:RNA polymerase subunit RPABC4/transcription elongation factor Spt4